MPKRDTLGAKCFSHTLFSIPRAISPTFFPPLFALYVHTREYLFFFLLTRVSLAAPPLLANFSPGEKKIGGSLASVWESDRGSRRLERSRRRYSGQVVSRNCGRRGQQIACFRASLHHSVTLLTLAGNPSAYLV